MVKIEEVEDEEFERANIGEKDFLDDDADFTDTDSSISDDDEHLPTAESLTDRLAALRDIIPPATRRRIISSAETVAGYVKGGVWFGGKAMWVVSTSLLLFGVPFALALVDEQGQVEMEREARMREMGNELLAPGASAPEGKAPL